MNTWKDSQLDRVKVRQSRIEGNRRKERQNRTEKKDRIGQKRKKVIEKDGERERDHDQYPMSCPIKNAIMLIRSK